MTNEDPQLAEALRRSANARELLTRMERVLSLPRSRITSDLTFPLRAIMAIERNAAQAWNILATVREPQPEQPATSTIPHPDFRAIEARGCDIPTNRTNQ